MSIELVLARTHGVCRTSTLKRAGFTAHAIREAVADGRLVRLRQGVFAVDAGTPVARAAQHGGTVACVSALSSRGVWVLADDTLHVGVSAYARAHPHHRCSCVVHRDRLSTGFGLASVRTALVQTARCLGEEAFFVALESALNKRLISQRDRVWIRARVAMPLALLVDFARSDAESGLESLVRLRLYRLGIVARTQVYIRGVGRVDLLIGDLIIEVDGRLNHEGPSLRHKDLQRDAAAARLGYRVARFDYAMVMFEWPAVLDTILALL